MSPAVVTLVECPRDAWQGLSRIIPSPQKAQYLRLLIEAGFRHLDAVSFVSPRSVPQVADSEEVLQLLGPVGDVEIIGIVMNSRGAERALATRSVTTVGFPYSISPTFAMRNQNQALDQSVGELARIQAIGLPVTVYISMAFGNPYGDPWSEAEVNTAVGRVANLGITTISLADTVGLANPADIARIYQAAAKAFPQLEIGLHLHSRPEETPGKALAAWDAGCRRFDSAIGGLGGCPFAQDDRVGNLDTAAVLGALATRGVTAGLGPLDELTALSETLR